MHGAAKAVCMEDLWVIFIAEWIKTTSTSCERWLNNFRIFGDLITESRSHFERWETVKKFTEVSLGRRRAELYRAWSDRTPTRRGMFFDVVTDKLDLYSPERRLEKEKCIFFCVLYNKSMYVMRLQDFNGSRNYCLQQCICRSILLVSVSRPFLASRVFLRDTLCHVTRKNGSYKWGWAFWPRYNIFRGQRSAERSA